MGIDGNYYHLIPMFIYGWVLLIVMSTTENKTSKDSTSTTKDAAAATAVNVTHVFDVANENFTKLVNESAKVQPQYAQAISNLQQEYIEAVRNAIQTITSVEKQYANSNSKFNNVIISDTAAPYIQGFVKQSNDFTNNIIRMADINNQLAINALNALRENVKNYNRTVEATAEFNSNMARAWATSYSVVQQQFATRRE
jgi:phosphoribosylanthranilate isomerase